MDHTTSVNPRPTLTLQQATKVTEQLYGVTITEISTLPSYIDQNFLVVDKEGSKHVLKIMNSEESKNTTLLEVQTLAMSFLHQHGVPAQTAVPTTTGQLMSMEEIGLIAELKIKRRSKRNNHYNPNTPLTQPKDDHTYESNSPFNLARLRTWCSDLLCEVVDLYPWKNHCRVTSYNAGSLCMLHVGKLAVTVDKTLQQLVSPNLDALKYDTLWHLSNIPLLEGYLSVMDGDPLQEVVKAVIEQYKSHVQPKIISFQKGIIHGDLNDRNIIVIPIDSGHHEVSGILDFSLLVNGCYVFELAITIMYLMLENPSPLDVGGAVLAGWESIMQLNDDERDSLFLLVLGRLCQSLVYGQHNVKKYPDNKSYLLTTAKSGSRLLVKLWELGKKEVERKWFSDARTFSVSKQRNDGFQWINGRE